MDNKIQYKNEPNLEKEWCLYILVFLFLVLAYVLFRSKLKKSRIVNYYKVDKKTFNKWLQSFCSDLIPDMDSYKQKRTISGFLYHQIVVRLGSPRVHPSLTKKTIVKLGEGTYNSLRKSVQEFPTHFGLPSYEVYLKLTKFPPNISQQILAQYR